MKGTARHGLIVITFFFAVVFFVMALIATVAVLFHSKNTGPVLTIDRGENIVAEPVDFPDMSPGDEVSAQFQVRVAHRETVTLHLRAEFSEEAAPLADVLNLKVSVQGREGALYSGQLATATDITLTLFGEDKTEDLRYEIVTKLDENAGVELQGQALAANYVWWVEETEFLKSTHSSWTIVVILIILLVLAVALALLQLALIPERRGR